MQRITLGALVLGVLSIFVTSGCQASGRGPTTLPSPDTSHIRTQDEPALVVQEQPQAQEVDRHHVRRAVANVVRAFREACIKDNEFWIEHEGHRERYACAAITYKGEVDWGDTHSGHRDDPFATE